MDAAESRAFEEIRAREYALLPERGELLSRTFGLRLSLALTRLFLRLRLRENAAMAVMALVGFAGAAVLSVGGWGYPIGFFLLTLHYLLDYCDGQLARQFRTSNAVAGVRDRLIHFGVQTATFLTLGFSLWTRHGTAAPLLAPALCYVWFQLRLLFAQLPATMYADESANLTEAETHVADTPDATQATNRGGRARWIQDVREISMNFDGFALGMGIAAMVAIPLEAAGVGGGADLVLGLLWIAVGSYAIHAVDFICTFARGDRIARDIEHYGRSISARYRGER